MTKRRHSFRIAFFVTLTLLVLLLVGGGCYMLSYALRPVALMESRYATSWERLCDDYPWLTTWADSIRTTGALRDTTMRGQEGERLHAYYLEAAEPTRHTAVIVHGYTDNAIRMLMIGYLYHHDLGFNILLPDLHFHGQSEGRAIRMGWLDRLDVARWAKMANERFRGDAAEAEIVVHGISMGAATTMMLSGDKTPSYLRCFVEDCGYTSVWEEFAKELKGQFSLPTFPLLDATSLLCQLRYGWNFREASALRQVAHAEKPMLFIHGDADDFVPTRMVYPLYEAHPGPKELWIVPGVDHAHAYREAAAEYTDRVRRFVMTYMTTDSLQTTTEEAIDSLGR